MALAAEKRDIKMKIALERDVRLVRFEDGRLEFAPPKARRRSSRPTLSKRLANGPAGAGSSRSPPRRASRPCSEKADAEERDRMTGVRADPLVRAVLERFPGARDHRHARHGPGRARAAAARRGRTSVADAPFDFDGIDDDDL